MPLNTCRCDSPLDFVISVNPKRRHLTHGQKVMIGDDAEQEYAKMLSRGRDRSILNLEVAESTDILLA